MKNIKSELRKAYDGICELEMLMKKLNVLTEDIYINYFFNIDLHSKCGRYIAEYDYKIAALKTDMIREYMTEATQKLNNVLKIIENEYCH